MLRQWMRIDGINDSIEYRHMKCRRKAAFSIEQVSFFEAYILILRAINRMFTFTEETPQRVDFAALSCI